MNHLLTIKKIFEQINQADNILLLTHREPDGDALGSICALADYLKKIGKECQIFDFGEIPPNFYFLPNSYRLLQPTLKPNNYDLMIILDCGEFKLSGLPDEFRQNKNIPLINIDHHFSNNNYGDINLVVTDAASTTEILTEFFNQSKIKIDKNLATYLLTGVVTDTNNFTNPAANFSSFQTAAYLMGKGVKLSAITNYTFKNKSLNALRFWGQALIRLKHNYPADIISTVITRQDFKLFNLTDQDVEGLANFLIGYSSHKVVMVIRELADGKIKGSLRSTDEMMDVSRLAKVLGGGGHKKAAAFVIEGRLKQNQFGWEIV